MRPGDNFEFSMTLCTYLVSSKQRDTTTHNYTAFSNNAIPQGAAPAPAWLYLSFLWGFNALRSLTPESEIRTAFPNGF